MVDPVPGLESRRPVIRLTVKVFAGLREQAGWGERMVTLAAGPAATPQRLWQILQIDQVGVQPGASLADGPLPRSVRVAVNQCFAEQDQPLGDGDEVAFLPAISGG